MAELSLSCFDDFLQAARQQPNPQRLLFVFAAAELPDESTPEQQRRFASGEGGALTPLMCVDKALEDISTFAELAAESRLAGPDWAIVFVAVLEGKGRRVPGHQDAAIPLQRMVDSIKSGSHGSFIPFDRDGVPVVFE